MLFPALVTAVSYSDTRHGEFVPLKRIKEARAAVDEEGVIRAVGWDRDDLLTKVPTPLPENWKIRKINMFIDDQKEIYVLQIRKVRTYPNPVNNRGREGIARLDKRKG